MKRLHYFVSGIVQGVGFRPFINRVTKELGLHGYIKNTANGVEIELEGYEDSLTQFQNLLRNDPPPLAMITDIKIFPKKTLKNYKTFEILKSDCGEANTLISPDISICKDCFRELFDKTNERYQYPFINCTNCGPRFTIIKDVPYDRPYTSMKEFELCEFCSDEYKDIENRRYHAQPVCCENCGPTLLAYSGDGEFLRSENQKDYNAWCIEWAKSILFSGGIIAIKGLGGIHLACDLRNEKSVKRLREIKHRDEKPFAVMCRGVETVKEMCELSSEEEKILTSLNRPITLLEKKDINDYKYISDNSRIGVMLAYTPLHYLLMNDFLDSLVMTSANFSNSPIIINNDYAIAKLQGIDGFLLNNRDVVSRCDDSLVAVVGSEEYFYRRSRGYAPSPIRLNKNLGDILACGAEQKASFGVSKGEKFFQSAYIGDLKNLDTLEAYSEQVSHFERMFGVNVSAIVCDMHPEYLSTQFAVEESKKRNVPLLQVQHHYAHFASCMADNLLDEECIGVIYDGTGYGENGEIWGGEIFTGNYDGYTRHSSIREIALVGGDSSIKKIYRLGSALLFDANLECSPFINNDRFNEVKLILTSSVPVMKASSIGRLFDAVSSIIGICEVADYEGQGAILLESIARKDVNEHYTLAYYTKDEIEFFDTRVMVSEIVEDMKNNVKADVISAKFMNTLAKNTTYICEKIRSKTSLNKVCLSGGVFQNLYLLNETTKRLENKDFMVYRHHRTSCNDEGIALGQMMIMSSYVDGLLGGK